MEIFIAVFVTLIIVALIWINSRRRDSQDEQSITQEETNQELSKNKFPPVPKWQPNLPTDTKKVLEKAKYYTDSKLQLAVFRNGTITIFPNRVESTIDSAKETLNKIINFHGDFKPLTMDDGNYLIEYSQPAFTIVFKDEIENHWNYINENHQDGLCTSEVLLNANHEPNTFDKIGKISLFGRAKMYMDAQEPEVVEVFDPND